MTKVIFRVWLKKPHNVIALFPQDVGNLRPDTCDSYEHVGQHGAADYSGVMAQTRAAQPAEYADLKDELESAGYELMVAKRASREDFLARDAEIERILAN